ncbi:MAG: hypothetical protein IT507_10355 [Burkholderiaceae bacterium]|nr:hypothetical protein [Burkholderiaceae bacterium]
MSLSIGRTILSWVTGAVVLAGAGALVGAYVAGRPGNEDLALQLKSERAARSQAALEWDAQLQAATRRVEQTQGELAVERAARIGLERSLQNAEKDLGLMRDKLAFYEQLLPPGPQGSIDVRAFEVQPQADGLSFRVLLMRSGKPGERFSGSLQFVATGLRDGRSDTVVLKPLQAQIKAAVPGASSSSQAGTPSADQAPDVLKLEFDQFQRGQGLLAVPEGFTPLTVTVRVVEGEIILASRRVDL